MNEKEKIISDTCPTMTKTINGTTYIVSVHFREDSRDTLEDKLHRLLDREIRRMISDDNREISHEKERDKTYEQH